MGHKKFENPIFKATKEENFTAEFTSNLPKMGTKPLLKISEERQLKNPYYDPRSLIERKQVNRAYLNIKKEEPEQYYFCLGCRKRKCDSAADMYCVGCLNKSMFEREGYEAEFFQRPAHRREDYVKRMLKDIRRFHGLS